MFGVTCGDKFVSSYQEGVMIMYGIYMEFDSMVDKFTVSPYTDVASTLADIQSTVKYRPTQGNVTLAAWQIGGNPDALRKILPNKTT